MDNEFKIRFGNAFHAVDEHIVSCEQCWQYLYSGDGDMCNDGKAIVALELLAEPTFNP